IDTLRADHVGAYGHAGARTPQIDALAARGALFREAIAHSPWTGPSHLSILTGLLPQSHRARVNGAPLAGDVPTLADDLRRRGYRTGAFVSGWPLKAEAVRLASRFERYSEGRLDLVWKPLFEYRSLTLFRYLQNALGRFGVELFFHVERDAESVTSSASAWLAEVAGEPFFAWVHYYDPHLPYTPPAAYRTEAARAYSGRARGLWYELDPAGQAEIVSVREDLDHMLSLYDAEIAFVDAEIGRLLEAAGRSAPPAGLLVVVTSDHGEDMGEHDHYFMRDLYESTLRVPLVIVPPASAGIPASAIDAQVSLVDLAPTILDLLHVEPERPFDGRSVVGLLEKRPSAAVAPALSVLDVERREMRQRSYSVRHEGWKLIHRTPGWNGHWWKRSRNELYDLRTDPAETRDLSQERPESVARLEALLRPYVESDGPRSVDLDEEQVRSLRALGYLQ
ncbi:MAG: sulfatase family protein, partial [Candidatus Binatia bacterium]